MVFQCLIFVVDRHYCSSVSTSYGFFNSSLRTLIARTHTYIKLSALHILPQLILRTIVDTISVLRIFLTELQKDQVTSLGPHS